MDDKVVKQVEKFFIVATIAILILLFFLKTTGSHFAQETEEPLPAGPVPAAGYMADTAAREDETPPAVNPVQAANIMEGAGAKDEDKPQPAEGPAVSENEQAGEAVLQENILQEQTNLAIVKMDNDLELETRAELSRGQSSGHNLRVCVQVANTGGATATGIRLEIPLLGDLNSPYQSLAGEMFTPEPLEIKTHAFGNRSATFNIDFLAPGDTETITLDYYLNITPLTADLSAYAPTPTFSAGRYIDTAYLCPAEKIECSHPEITAKACEITGSLDDNLDKARAIFSFVLAHMHYDLNAPNRNGGALAALRSASGVCEDYAALFVALCRAEDIPARLVNGYTDPQGRGDIWNLSPGETLPLKGYRHCWAEFYLEGMGWLPADPTLDIYHSSSDPAYFAALPRASHLAQNYADQSMRVRFQGGKLDVTWEEGLAGL